MHNSRIVGNWIHNTHHFSEQVVCLIEQTELKNHYRHKIWDKSIEKMNYEPGFFEYVKSFIKNRD